MASFATPVYAATEAPVRIPPTGGFYTLLLLGVTGLMLVVSPQLLALFGIAYEEAGGSPLEKIHPATLLAFATLGIAMLASGRPLAIVDQLIHGQRAIILYIVAVLLLMAHSLLVVQLPFTGPIDTFLLPVILFILLQRMTESRASWIALLLHAGMFANAVLGLAEFLFSFRLVPFTAGGVAISGDWRSTALLGHPLSNASLTGAYMLCLAGGGGRDLPALLRPLAFAVAMLSMVAFGGRTAFLIALVMLTLIGGYRLIDFFMGARLQLSTIIAAIFTVPMLLALLTALASTGFFDRFVERFVDDLGSAQARVDMFELFDNLTWYDILLGPDAAYIDTMKRRLGLEFGIESFWVAFILTYGTVISLPVFFTLLLFCRELARVTLPPAILVIAFFFLVASTSVSLSAKSTTFAMFVLQITVLLRRSPSSKRHLDAGRDRV